MNSLLGTATLEEFLDLFQMLWFVRLLSYFLLLIAVTRMWKDRRMGGGVLLMCGFWLLVVSELMASATHTGWIQLGYSPSYASMREEWDMGGADWQPWEPLFWWSRFALGVIGMALAAVGFVMAGRWLTE